jgi:uncharacterized protein
MHFSSRRFFLKALSASAVTLESGLGAVSKLFGSGKAPMADVVVNRAPLAPNHFYPLPLGAIRPKGWLLDQLRIQAQGLSGHLDEFWPDLGPESGWLGGHGESWERGPYYLDGLVPLAHLLDDRSLITKSNRWVDWTLANQSSDGMIGPAGNDDWWPRMVMLKVLAQHHEATDDPRVIPLMQKYFKYQLGELPKRPLRDWGKYRWQDELLSVFWLYNRTGDRDLLRLADVLHQQGYIWREEFENFTFKEKCGAQELGLVRGALPPDRAMQTHGVNIAMGLKSSAFWWLLSRDDADRAGVERQLAALDAYHGMATGMFSADEHLAGRNPSQGVELCTVVENMFSLEQVIPILREVSLADRLERIAYNALPGTFTDDMWAHQYDQQPNQIECTLAPRPWTTNGPESNLYGLAPHFGCCCANMHQGWPKFAASLWMANAYGGVAAIAYAPCDLRTRISGVPVVIQERTGYPFDDNINLTLQPAKPLRFPLSLRIPRWAAGASVHVNGKAVEQVRPGEFATVERTWSPGDHVALRFPMKGRAVEWQSNAVVVERGPVLFSLNIETAWRKLRTQGMTADWEARPLSPWNYALHIDQDAKFAEQTRSPAPGKSIFTLENAPVTVAVQGRKISEWKPENGVASQLPPNSLPNSEPLETLPLVPYAAAKLRITVFPASREPEELAEIS